MRRLWILTGLLLLGSALWPRAVEAQVVYGEVTDGPSGVPIAGVRLQLRDLEGRVVASADSDDEGRFELQAPAGGLYSLHAERIGYSSFRSDAVSIADGGSIEVLVRLGVEAIPLAPFVVLADSQIRRGRAAEFERRRNDPTVGGHFLDSSDIRSRPTATPTQLLRALPSVDLYRVQTVDNPMGPDRSLIYLPGSRGGSLRSGMCLAQVFVNGIAMRQTQDGHFTVDDMLQGAPLLGVELYTRAAAAPVEFRGTGECGVVLYWTEEPAASSGSWNIGRIAVGVGAIVGVLIAGFVG